MAMASFSLSFPHPTKSNPIPLSNNNNKIPQSNSKLKVSKKGQFPTLSVKETSNFSNQTGNKKIPIKNMVRKNEVWVNTVTEALSDCIDNKEWLQALEVFEMLRKQPFYEPGEETYKKLLVLLGKSGQPERAHQLFDKMIEEGLEPTKDLYTALIDTYCRNNAITEAFSVLEQMKTLPLCQPDVYTFNILIKACIDDCRFDLVDLLYEQMDECSITPNTFTQTFVLSGYGKAGRYEQMEKVFSGMLVSTTCMPDVRTMNTILSLFGKKGQIELMEKWYEKFCNFGIEPETHTFNILISAYGKKRMYGKMFSVMGYMRKLAFPWTTPTYNNIIDVFAEVGDAEKMEYTFDRMRAEEMKIDNRTFCCLIRGYANAGLFHKVQSSVQLAAKLEIPENSLFYNAVIYASAKAGDLMEMDRV
ncbi:hypothetical protein LIER_14173 [Lithospermum erythrorhizon]|uniref:Pentatricopeptide repeat-containing protein n=1 Tax=Lithospermum erythrorhizon TaxID=34254 RepID=A0AAV3Q038_LITER